MGFMDDKDNKDGVYGCNCSFPRHSGIYGKTLSHGREPI